MKLAASLFLSACILLGSSPVFAQGVGDLLVAPTRIVLEGRKRTAEVALVNIGTGTATYRVSLINQRMTEDGRFEQVKEPLPGELFCDKIVRFTPRQVTLDPRVAQVVRLQVRKPADLPPGEYRSHLLLRAIPKIAPAEAPADAEATGLGINLIPIYGVSIAVIVRHETSPSEVTLSDLKYASFPDNDRRGKLIFRIGREGNQSVYGNLIATFTPQGSDKAIIVGRALGVAVYTPNPHRDFTMNLEVPEGQKLQAGKLDLIYRLKPDAGGDILAEASVAVP